MFEKRSREGSRILIYVAILVLGPASFLVHEFGHWAAGEAIGVEMWMSLNKAGPVARGYDHEWQAIIIALAGPAATILVALLASLMIRGPLGALAYGVVYFQFVFRLVAGGITLFSDNPNDEAAAGLMLEVSIYPITIAVAAFLFFLTWNAARHIRPGWGHNIGAYVLSNLVISAFVFSDVFLRGREIYLLGSGA